MNPYCRIGDGVAVGIANRPSAAVYLKSLAEHGRLQETKAGRENPYISSALLAALSDLRPTEASG